jgi:hypothetical protein
MVCADKHAMQNTQSSSNPSPNPNSPQTSAAPAPRSNRCLPVEQWPESIEILQHLTRTCRPSTIKDIAIAVGAPEISTRNRLIRLEAASAVSAQRSRISSVGGRMGMGTLYGLTQYGRDCASGTSQTLRAMASSSIWQRTNSVFAWCPAPESAS